MKGMQAKRAALAAVWCVALAACGSAPRDAGFIASPSPAATAGPSPTPVPSPTSVASPSSAPTPSPSPSESAFSPAPALPSPSPSPLTTGACRVPIADISEAKGWFITIPGGSRQDDPASVVALPGGTPGQIGANPGLIYDHSTDTWVPVPYNWLAPGGSLYAYEGYSNGIIRAVNVVDGSSGTVVTGGGWLLMTTADDGVYVTKSDAPGVWFIPFGGDPRVVIDHGSWQRLANGYVWGVDNSGNVVRHDLISGDETKWATVPANAWIVGFDLLGDPLLDAGGALSLVRAGNSVTSIWPGTNGSVGGRAIGDANGVWFEVGGGLVGAPGHGLYLWTAAAGAHLISSDEGNLAGGCL